MRLTLATPPRFVLSRTVRSHGWCRLAPFGVDGKGRLLGVVRGPGGRAVAYSVAEGPKGTVVVQAPGRGDAATRRLLGATVRRVLNLDLDLEPFHDRARRIAGMGWMASLGAGRLLRAPTLFEDLIKLVLTTNCTWAFTVRMVETLVERYGEPAPCGRRAFPGPEALARGGVSALRDRCRTGYRAPSLARLARATASGRLDPEGWESDPRDPAELRRDLLGLPGVGPYVAENVLRLLGRPAGLALDSWLRAKYAEVYHGGRRVTDRTIGRRYAPFGNWAGLALWCDMTREWIDDRGRVDAR